MSVSFWRVVPGEEAGLSRAEIAVILLTMVTIMVLTAFMAPGRLSRIGASRERVPRFVSALERTAGDTYRLGDGEEPWRAARNVTAVWDKSTYVEGARSIALSVGEAFPGGIIASYDLADGTQALDLTGYQSIAFWVKSSGVKEDDLLQLVLQEAEPDGDTAEALSLPGGALDGAGWHQVTLRLSGRTERYDAVRSLALVATGDPGRLTVWLDVIEARTGLDSSHALKTRTGNGALLTTAGTVLTVPQRAG